MNIKRVGIDLAKQVFQVHGVDSQEKAVLRRAQMLDYFKKLPPCLIGMEACSSAHYCGRRNKNIAAVALTNKNTRIAWALLSKKTGYLPPAGRRTGLSEGKLSNPSRLNHPPTICEATTTNGKQVEPAFAKPYDSSVP